MIVWHFFRFPEWFGQMRAKKKLRCLRLQNILFWFRLKCLVFPSFPTPPKKAKWWFQILFSFSPEKLTSIVFRLGGTTNPKKHDPKIKRQKPTRRLVPHCLRLGFGCWLGRRSCFLRVFQKKTLKCLRSKISICSMGLEYWPPEN